MICGMTLTNMQRAESSMMTLRYEKIIDQAISQKVIGKNFKNLWHWIVSEGACHTSLKKKQKDSWFHEKNH
jgi:hypothetical protein